MIYFLFVCFKLKETKAKVDETAKNIDKYSSDSAVKIKQVENNLSGFNIKNEVWILI